MKKICVFCGSSPGARSSYRQAAAGLGTHLAKLGIGMVYGGAKAGLMAEAAEACLVAGGEVIGVLLERFVQYGLVPSGLTRLEIVKTMHERKSLMSGLSDGFIALPGGLGTLDEFFEALTWTQIGIHDKPCGLLNIEGYYDSLIVFLEKMVKERFLLEEHEELLLVDDDPISLVEKLQVWSPHRLPKWVDRHVSGEGS